MDKDNETKGAERGNQMSAAKETKTLTNIQTLLMFDTGIGDEGVQVIMASDSFSKLKTFRVT